MALEKIVTTDKIEIVEIADRNYKMIRIRDATIIKEDGTELNRSFHRRMINPAADWSSETAEIKAICDAVHTAESKEAYKKHIAEEPAAL